MKTRAIKDSDCIVIDYETYGDESGFQSDPTARVFSFSLTWVDDGFTEVCREEHDPVYFEKRMKEFWSSPCEAIAHNAKFELHFTQRMGWLIHPKKIVHDTMIMHQYIDNLSMFHNLEYVAGRYAGYVKEWNDNWNAVEKAKKIYNNNFKLIPEYIMHPYQIADGEATASVFVTMKDKVEPWSEYLNELELLKVTMSMEQLGFMVDVGNTEKLLKSMEQEISSNLTDIEGIVGRAINLNSPKQILKYFEEIGINGQTSTDNKALEKLREKYDHPILDCIMKSRAYTKGISTLQDYIKHSRHDKAIHPNIKTNHARTGRESCENPNMQNVSKEKKAGARYTVAARSCFRARPGYILLLGDYAGIEMRLGVQGTGSPRLIKLCEENFDFHDACAAAFYGKAYTELTDKSEKKAKRNQAKAARFAMFYGAGLEQTANTLGLSIEEVAVGFAQDKKVFPEFYKYMADCSKHARDHGYIETFFGRKLRVEQDRPYSATDYVIQGSAGALFKHAQVKVHNWFEKELGREQARLILPVHDELVMEIHRKQLPYLNDIMVKVNELMTDCKQITVPIVVDFNLSTHTWDKKKEISYAKAA
jgi:DNA polymerase-1